jgi:transposase
VANLQPCLIGIEACAGAHFWARHLRDCGHEVKLIAPQFVKPYVKSNKNDRADAQAICEAVQRPTMRFVTIKGIEQQDIQCLHRIRSQVVANRTALVNQVRGLLLEYGVDVPVGIRRARERLPRVLEDAENGLTERFRGWLADLYTELVRMDERVAMLDKDIERSARIDENAKRLMSIPGIGPMCATALVAAIGDIRQFKNGRELSAWLGLVPRQCSTGGKPRLLGISKRGDVYLRQLLVHGARSVVQRVDGKSDQRSRWLQELLKRRNKNVAIVALANKIVRTAYALLANNTEYCTDPGQLVCQPA